MQKTEARWYANEVKSLYGLKRAGNEWNKLLHKFLVSFGLERSDADHCCYVKKEEVNRLFIAVWVDDLLFFSTSEKMLSEFRAAISKEFRVDDKGQMKWFLGISVTQIDGEIRLCQTSFIENTLEEFGMLDCKSIMLPAMANTYLSKDDCPKAGSKEEDEMQRYKSLYRSLVGKLNYLSVVSRPDLSFAVSSLSQFLQNPGMPHWIAAKRILRYLQGTKSFFLSFKREDLQLTGHTDADWGSNPTIDVR